MLSTSRRQMIASLQNDVFISIASLWEIAIKVSLGKLTLAQPLADVTKQLATENIEILPTSSDHVLQVSILPFHHRDPFDRLIIAQSGIENLTVITNDTAFANYGINLS